jgi:AraC-like DNA-binding protein
MYGVMRFDHVAAQRLVELLPPVVHLESGGVDETGWLESTLRFITREAASLRPGGETVITRLSDIVVIQAIRAWLDKAPEARRGWLGALQDPQVGRAIASIHREPQRAWTVDLLAHEAAMSRSAFSERFTRLLGEPAMRYVTRWRLQLARARLQETSEPLSTLASTFGYESESSFCRAFKRFYGVSPGSLRSPRTTRSGA